MADYIKREDAIKAFDPLQRQDWYTPWIVETLKDLTSADVAPVRHGRWIDDGDKTVCSLCHGSVSFSLIDGKWTYGLYCQTCGAKMR